MTDQEARVLRPARIAYHGNMTRPDRWACWTPRVGDVLVCTPSKSGTTWTQSIVAMLLAGQVDLPESVSTLSPWIDADLAPAPEMTARLAAQTGRRMVKTHTPADGFPVWEGVTVIAVYRHPLDVFFSLRKHALNFVQHDDSHPMRWALAESFAFFLDNPADTQDFDRDSLETLVRHYRETVLAGRIPELVALHYSVMRADHRGTVARLAAALGCEQDPALIDRIVAATDFAAMKARPSDFVPEGGKGVWRSDSAFFDAGTSAKWEGKLSPAQLAAFTAKLRDLLPDRDARDWLLTGARAD